MTSDNAVRLGFFGVHLANRMEEQGLTINQLAGAVNCTYEHIRKMVACDALPSDVVLKDICAALKLNLARAKRLVVTDRMRKRYGATIWLLAGKDPSMEPIYILAPYLTERQLHDFIVQMCAVARQNRKKGGEPAF